MERSGPKGTNRVTTQQLSRMISALETAPDIANNLVKGPQTAFWRKVAWELNDLGPAVRDATSWKKVWFDYKSGIKKRVKQHNEDIKLGIYPKHLTPIHKRIIKLLNMKVKVAKVTEAVDSDDGEDMNSDDTTNDFKDEPFDPEDSTPLASMLQDASDDNMNPTRTSPRAINACQKRLEKLPNITVVKQNHDNDPLSNGANNFSVDEESIPVASGNSRKRAYDAHFRKALETNKAMILAVKASLTSTKGLTAELQLVKKSYDELNENVKNLTSTMRELIQVLKNK